MVQILAVWTQYEFTIGPIYDDGIADTDFTARGELEKSVCDTIDYRATIAGNFCKEKIFTNIATHSCWRNFYLRIFCPMLITT